MLLFGLSLRGQKPMSKFQIYRTDSADAQITEIIRYMATDSGKDVALSRLTRLEAQIKTLEAFPFLGTPPKYAALRRQGYRFLTSDRWLIFYKVFEIEKKVIIYAVLDAARDYLHLL